MRNNKYSGNFDVVDGFCHDRECELFGIAQKLAVSKPTFYEDSNWIDDPECRMCLGELKQDKPDMTDWEPPGWDEDSGVEWTTVDDALIGDEDLPF